MRLPPAPAESPCAQRPRRPRLASHQEEAAGPLGSWARTAGASTRQPGSQSAHRATVPAPGEHSVHEPRTQSHTWV